MKGAEEQAPHAHVDDRQVPSPSASASQPASPSTDRLSTIEEGDEAGSDYFEAANDRQVALLMQQLEEYMDDGVEEKPTRARAAHSSNVVRTM